MKRRAIRVSRAITPTEVEDEKKRVLDTEKKRRNLRAALLKQLKRFPETDVTQFIGVVQFHVEFSEGMRGGFQDNRIRKGELTNLRKMLDKAIQDLMQPIHPTMVPTVREAKQRTTDGRITFSTLPKNQKANEKFRSAQYKAVEALGKLKVVTDEVLKDNFSSLKPGVRMADYDGLFACIADEYRRLLGETPVTTPGEVFSNICVEVLTHITGKRRQDVSRTVLKALKKTNMTN